MRIKIFAGLLVCIALGVLILGLMHRLNSNTDPDLIGAEGLKKVFTENEDDFDYVASLLLELDESICIEYSVLHGLSFDQNKPNILKDEKFEKCLKKLLGGLKFRYVKYFKSANGLERYPDKIYFGGNAVIRYNDPPNTLDQPRWFGILKENWYYSVPSMV